MQAGDGSSLASTLARLCHPQAYRAFIGLYDGGEIGCANQHAGQIYRHNLRMHAHTKLINPFVSSPALGAALQSNKVYPSHLSPLPAIGIAARQINAIP